MEVVAQPSDAFGDVTLRAVDENARTANSTASPLYDEALAGTRLCAVLASPPLTTGARTLAHLGVAAEILGCDQVRVVNLFGVATDDIPAISLVGQDAAGWMLARPSIAAAFAEADILLAAWGVGLLTGAARKHRQAQLRWLAQVAAGADHSTALSVGQARHPSRWHQYVSDRHGRVQGDTFSDRLRQVLLPRSLEELTGGSQGQPSSL
jgi:hypothetical protein